MSYEPTYRDLEHVLHAARRVAVHRAMLREFAEEFGSINPPAALERDYRDALDLLESVVGRVGARVWA